jgi:methylphosphotriester-DNA--protein-cysteine methyltransferase
MLEQAVAQRLPAAPELDALATEAFDRLVAGEATGLAALASSLWISERQLRRRYETAIGLGPKAVHRIVRFQRFLALAWTLERPSDHLALLAAEAGYADQSHLARDAARLEGRTPRAILLESQQRCGCGHDHAASYRPLLANRRPLGADAHRYPGGVW